MPQHILLYDINACRKSQRCIYREPSDRIGLEAIMAHPWLAGVGRSMPPVLCRSNISEALHQSVIDTMIEGKKCIL